MNKRGLTAFVRTHTGLKASDSEQAVNAVFEGIASSLKAGEEASFIGSSSFTVVQREARDGRSPRTGEPLKIAASKSIKFKAGKTLKESLG